MSQMIKEEILSIYLINKREKEKHIHSYADKSQKIHTESWASGLYIIFFIYQAFFLWSSPIRI